MRETQMRCPRMHGLPKQVSALIRWREYDPEDTIRFYALGSTKLG
jgi:hypothetical protein